MILTRTMLTICCTGCSLMTAVATWPLPTAAREPARGPFEFVALPASAPASSEERVFSERAAIRPAGRYTQRVVAREGDGGATDNWDMNTLNETGPCAGPSCFARTKRSRTDRSASRICGTGMTQVLVERADWNRMDGIVWTPWRTLLTAEEMRLSASRRHRIRWCHRRRQGWCRGRPRYRRHVPRPALGAKAHEGIRFDPKESLWHLGDRAEHVVTPPPVPGHRHRPPACAGGYIFKFAPIARQNCEWTALRAEDRDPDGDRTATRSEFPRSHAVQVDADAEATRAGATGYARPEDVEIATSTGNNAGGNDVLYVAVTDEHRILRIDLREPGRRGPRHGIRVRLCSAGVNAPMDFTNPDNLALDKDGNLFITEERARRQGWTSGWPFPHRDSRTARRKRCASPA